MVSDQTGETVGLSHLHGSLTVAQQNRVKNARVLIAGLGNIGSWLAVFLAPVVSCLRLVDRDREVQQRNTLNQLYEISDLGHPKALALAQVLRRRCAGVEIMSHIADLEDAPLGWFADSDIVLTGLHSLRGRQRAISELAWPLGVPVVDGAVGEPWLGNVRVLVPGRTNGCLECPWGTSHYRQLAQEYPCLPNADADAPPTRSPAFLGASVASLMVAQCIQLLAGPDDAQQKDVTTEAADEVEGGLVSRLTEFDLIRSRMISSRLRRAARCRFDHEIIRPQCALQIPVENASLADVVEVIDERWPGAKVQVETRRLPWTERDPQRRFFDLEELRAQGSRSLTALGLSSDDALRIRVSAEESTSLLWLNRNIPRRCKQA